MSGGMIKMPVVMRVSVGSKYGAQHSQDWSSIVAHMPGLKVIFPTTTEIKQSFISVVVVVTVVTLFLSLVDLIMSGILKAVL
jgi:2-oxoisovalerate dehydrogenase E1 component